VRSAQELEAIPKRIRGVESLTARVRLVFPGSNARPLEPAAQLRELLDLEGRVALGRRPEFRHYPEMKLLIADAEPDPAASLQVRRLGNLGESEQRAKEASRRVFRTRRDLDLDVMEAGHRPN
jgi:hypothetical protein